MSGDAPETVEEVVAWFMSDGGYDENDLRKLIDGMMTLDAPWGGEPGTPSDAWNWIIDFDLLHQNSKTGWITREGKLLGAGFAAHDRLIYWLGKTTEEVEADGWAWVGREQSYKSFCALSERQMQKLDQLGIVIDYAAELQKPKWVRGGTHPARRHLGI